MRSAVGQPNRSAVNVNTRPAPSDDNELMYQPAVSRSRRLPLVESPHRSINTNNSNLCFHCQQPGHYAASCPQAGANARSTVNAFGAAGAAPASGTCFKCGQTGHWANSCPGPS